MEIVDAIRAEATILVSQFSVKDGGWLTRPARLIAGHVLQGPLRLTEVCRLNMDKSV
jgi:hypothetical protein